MKSLRRDALLEGAELNRRPSKAKAKKKTTHARSGCVPGYMKSGMKNWREGLHQGISEESSGLVKKITQAEETLPTSI
eukprot:925972-Pelagomonas_calceolata.AAC.1